MGRPRQAANDGSDYVMGAQIIRFLLQNQHIDFLGLGEVTEPDLERLLADMGLACFDFCSSSFQEGRARFDTGAILNTSRLQLIAQRPIFHRHGNNTLKIATQVELFTTGDPVPFHVFISHWPSHIAPDTESFRVTLGSRFGQILQEMIRSDPKCRIIVMGDFNEEPFHESLQGQLLATRDRTFATSHSCLYNPFWRLLGETEPYSFATSVPSYAGTCYLSAGKTTKWKTVDQIMFSPAFLGNSEWHLNEAAVEALPVTPMAIQKNTRVGIFDHFPVVARIERVREAEGETHV